MGGKMKEWMGDIAAAEQSWGLPFRLRILYLCGVWGRLRAALRASCTYSWLHYSTHQGLIENGGGETNGKGLEIFLKNIYKYNSASQR